MPSWKKIIVSGSNAELNQLTATSFGGNISGSGTTTGSFGRVEIDNNLKVEGQYEGDINEKIVQLGMAVAYSEKKINTAGIEAIKSWINTEIIWKNYFQNNTIKM